MRHVVRVSRLEWLVALFTVDCDEMMFVAWLAFHMCKVNLILRFHSKDQRLRSPKNCINIVTHAVFREKNAPTVKQAPTVQACNLRWKTIGLTRHNWAFYALFHVDQQWRSWSWIHDKNDKVADEKCASDWVSRDDQLTEALLFGVLTAILQTKFAQLKKNWISFASRCLN